MKINKQIESNEIIPHFVFITSFHFSGQRFEYTGPVDSQTIGFVLPEIRRNAGFTLTRIPPSKSQMELTKPLQAVALQQQPAIPNPSLAEIDHGRSKFDTKSCP
jgi:hypothetical protein